MEKVKKRIISDDDMEDEAYPGYGEKILLDKT